MVYAFPDNGLGRYAEIRADSLRAHGDPRRPPRFTEPISKMDAGESGLVAAIQS